MLIENCSFENSLASKKGGALTMSNVNASLLSSVFLNNMAGEANAGSGERKDEDSGDNIEPHVQ